MAMMALSYGAHAVRCVRMGFKGNGILHQDVSRGGSMVMGSKINGGGGGGGMV